VVQSSDPDDRIQNASPYHFELTRDDIEAVSSGVRAVLESGVLSLGRWTTEFETAFAAECGAPYAVAVSSGTKALELLMFVKGLAGKTVLVPTNTNFATVAAALRIGAHVRYLDMSPMAFAPSLGQLTQALSVDPRPAAVAWVHIGGVVSPEFDRVVELCRRERVCLLEDASHAHGSRVQGLSAGALADGGAFSLYATKVLTAGEGGVVLVRDPDEAALLRSLRNQGKGSAAFGSWHVDFGDTARLSEMAAVLAVTQLRGLRQRCRKREAARRAMAAVFDRAGVEYVGTGHMDMPSNYKFIVLLPNGVTIASVRERLRQEKIFLGGGVYETPCHLQPAFEGRVPDVPLPVAERWCNQHICPPLTSRMSEGDAAYVAERVVSILSAIA